MSGRGSGSEMGVLAVIILIIVTIIAMYVALDAFAEGCSVETCCGTYFGITCGFWLLIGVINVLIRLSKR